MRSENELMSPPDFLSVREASTVLRIGRTCAYSLAREFVRTGGESGLPVVKVGRLLRVPRVAIEAMLGGPITWPPEEHASADELHALEPAPHIRHRKPSRSRRDDAIRG